MTEAERALLVKTSEMLLLLAKGGYTIQSHQEELANLIKAVKEENSDGQE